MARTPLFRALERVLTLSRLSLAAGRPAAELAGELAERRALTRRGLLRSAAVTGLGLGLGLGCRGARPPGGARPAAVTPSPAGRRGGPEVVIVGAGIAGLTAGYRLHQAGVGVRIVEAQARVGGRIFSLRDFFPEGQVAELGGELIDTGHTALRGLAGELGIELDDLPHADEGFDETVWHFAGRRISEAEVVAAYRPVAERIQADLATLPEGAWATYREPNGAEALDRTSLAEWLEGSGCEGWLCRLLDVAYTAEYGLETERQSALNLLALIDPEPDPFRIFGDSDERFHVRGGNDRITSALAARLDGAIETGARLEAVRERADGLLECSLRRGERSETLAAPYVVLALPFTLLRQVRLDLELPAAKRRAIDELGYGTNAKLMVGFTERLWRSVHGSNGSVVTDLGFQSTWETSRAQPGESGILTNFTGGEHGVALGEGSAAGQAARLVEGLERVFAGIAATRAGMRESRFHWPSHPFTRGSYACYLPGQWTTLAGAEGERVGRLYFAGEHCSLEAQGFMEGGCETGERAAREILAELDLAQDRTAA